MKINNNEKIRITLVIMLYYFCNFLCITRNFSDERRDMLTIAENYLFLVL